MVGLGAAVHRKLQVSKRVVEKMSWRVQGSEGFPIAYHLHLLHAKGLMTLFVYVVFIQVHAQ